MMARTSVGGPLCCIFIRIATFKLGMQHPWLELGTNVLMVTILLVSMMMGVMAFFRVRKDGVKGVVGMALAGVLLNGYLLWEAVRIYLRHQGQA